MYLGFCARPCRHPPNYAMEVHHGGTFSFKPMRVYNGGKIDTVHGLNPNFISLHEFDAMAKHLGYHSTVAFYYKMPGLSLDKGLVPITKDKDTTNMLNYLDKNRTAIIYLEHIGGVHCFDSAAQETDPNMQSNFDLGSFNFDPESGLEYINFDVGMFKLVLGMLNLILGLQM